MNPFLTIDEVVARRAAGEASPLLDAGLSPVLIEGRWWAIPEGEDVYRPVEVGVGARLDAAAARLAAARGR